MICQVIVGNGQQNIVNVLGNDYWVGRGGCYFYDFLFGANRYNTSPGSGNSIGFRLQIYINPES